MGGSLVPGQRCHLVGVVSEQNQSGFQGCLDITLTSRDAHFHENVKVFKRADVSFRTSLISSFSVFLALPLFSLPVELCFGFAARPSGADAHTVSSWCTFIFSKLLPFLLLDLFYEYLAYMNVCMPHMHACQKRALESLELKLQRIMSPPRVGAGN